MNKQAFEVAVDGAGDPRATIFANDEKTARRIMWDLLGEDQNNVRSLEVVWNYKTDGAR